MEALKALLYRAILTFSDAFLGAITLGAILSGAGHPPAITILEQAALAGAAPTISVLRNGLALLAPKIPTTLPANVLPIKKAA